jgi:hypothetical protein
MVEVWKNNEEYIGLVEKKKAKKRKGRSQSLCGSR